MDFYNCPYVIVIPFRNGNEYDEDYGCDATGEYCQCCQCKLTAEECEQLIRKHENQHLEVKRIMNKEPLTQHELQEMAGKPVHCPEIESYGIVKCETIGTWAGVPFLVGVWHCDGVAVNFEYNIADRKLKSYRINEDQHFP